MTALRTRLDALRATDSRGFTLIELLIVIVVIGILAGIAIFAVGGFQSDAKNACAQANSRISQTVNAANSITSGTYSTTGGGSCS